MHRWQIKHPWKSDSMAYVSRTQESVAVHLMVVMCVPGLGNSSIRSILQVVRMPLRSVDRIGAIDDSTLLVCVPSADAELAR